MHNSIKPLIKLTMAIFSQRSSSLLLRRRLALSSPRWLSTSPETFFPWRSSPTPLDRISIAPNDLSSPLASQSIWSLSARSMMVGRIMGAGWFSLALGSWKAPLAEDLQWAFRKAVAGLLCFRFKVPLSEIDYDAMHIANIDTSTPAETPWDDEQAKLAKQYVEQMMEENLLARYAENSGDQYNIKLSIEPIGQAEIEYAHCVPVVTRADVKRDPSIRKLYQNLDQEAANTVTADMTKLRGHLDLLVEKVRSRKAMTMIVDVSIPCREIFSITPADVGNAAYKQNDEKESDDKEKRDIQTVSHLVRFEREVDGEQMGNWRITDWDDLLSGNIWYFPRATEASKEATTESDTTSDEASSNDTGVKPKDSDEDSSAKNDGATTKSKDKSDS